MTQWGLDTLFNPAKRHMDEEKRRLQSTRTQVGDSSGGKRIDLDSGKVRIARPNGDEDPSEPEREADKPRNGGKKPSPAAIRAARRRGREPR
ncbi:MAG: hypothetical protein J2P17_20575 [Mycobacterium sp.]|nr:hypothetical protein [Mycobacterium sp.]